MEVNHNLNQIYSCSQLNIAKVAHDINRRYYMLFCDNLFFKCDTKNHAFDFIVRNDTRLSYEMLDVINGIKIVKHRVNTVPQFNYSLKRIRDKSKIPILFEIDVFDCEWTKFYQKRHIRHSILIDRISLNNSFYYCFDPFFSNETKQLNSSVINDKKRIYYLEFLPSDERNDQALITQACLKSVNKYYENLTHDNYAYKLNIISKMLFENYTLYENDLDFNIRDLPILRRFKEIEKDRITYTIYLKELEKILSINLIDSINICNFLCHKWSNIRMLLLKKILKHSDFNMHNEFNELINHEKKLCESLLSHFN